MTAADLPSTRLLSCLLVALSLPGVWNPLAPGMAADLPTGLDRPLAQVQPDAAPLYPPDAPPPRKSPLPDRRQDVEEQSVGADYRVSALQPDYQGALWVGSWQGLARIDPVTGKILKRVSLPNATVGAIAQDRSGRIWVGTYEGISRLDPRTGSITAQNFALPSNRVLSLLVDRRGFLWVGTDAGLALISPDQGLLMTTVKNLPGVSANALALDVLGNLWVGTLDGLVQINTANALIKRRVNNLPGVAVQTLAASPWGTLWIGTPTGLAEAEIGIERVVQTIAAPTPARSATARKQKPQGQSAKTAQATAKPAKPRQRVVFLTTQPDQFKLRSLSQVGKRSITSLHFDQVGSLWVGSTTGLLRVNPFNGATGGEIPYLPSSRILSLSPDTGGKLWVGTSEGLAWVDTATFRGHPHRTFLPTGR